MIEALERADEEQIFRRFAELPTELRVYVYELYFRSLDPLDAPGLPPSRNARA